MTSPFTGPAASASPDVIVHWLADLLSSEERLTEWQQLADGQRAAWLHDEGYDATELNGSLAAFSAAVDVDPALADAVQRFLRHGDAIPLALRSVLGSLLLVRLQRLDGLAGGAASGLGLAPQSFMGPNLLADYKAAHGAASKAHRLLQEASDTHLGRYIEVVGGAEDKVAAHITHQVDTEALNARTAAATKATQANALKQREQKAYNTRKQHFITQTEDKAVTAEINQIDKTKTAQAAGKHPIQAGKGGTSRPALTKQEQAVLQDDKLYFDAHDRATLQAGLIDYSYSVSGQGSSRSVTLNYDWDGSRGSVQVDRSTALGELDPALGALNRLTAHALWSARQSAAITTWDNQHTHPLEQSMLAKAHPKVASQLSRALQTNFPKAKLPTSFSQLIQQGQAAEAVLRRDLHTRERRARHHGVTLFSLQRQWDEKRLLHNPKLEPLPNPTQHLDHAGTALRSAVHQQLQAMALAVLVADVDKQLAASSKAQALLSQADRFAATHAKRLSALQAQLAQSTTTLAFSDRDLNLSWTTGKGIQVSRKAKDPKGAYAAEPTLSLDLQNRQNPKDSLQLSASYAPAGTLNGGRFGFSYFSSREDGTVVRQFSNAYTLSNTWQLRLEGVQALGGAELQAYKASLESVVNATVRQAATAQLQQHAAAWQGHGQLDALGQRTVKNAANLPRALHDIRVDRRIEAKIKPHYGSLRAQKLLLNQLQNDRASYIQAARTMRRIRNVKSLLRHDASRTIVEWKAGVIVDHQDFGVARKMYATKPYSVEKKSSGNGYKIVKNSTYKDYWQKLTEKQRYKIFNPIYHSESIFFKSERMAFLAGAGEYTTLRRDGASKKMARLGASDTYFNTLLREDGVLYKKGLATKKLAYSPFILRRQLHMAKHVVHLDRHPFAWRMRLSWKVKRERFIYKHVAAYEKYMKNHKFTGFHPFHRIARKSLNIIKWDWHFVLGPIVHRLGGIGLWTISIFSPKAATWIGHASTKVFKGVTYLAYHALKAIWHLPEHLYHHTIYFGKQLLFAISHPWEYRKIWTGLKKDFKGIYRLAKTIGRLVLWLGDSFLRSIYQVGRWMTGQGANWGSIKMGLFHKKLWHQAKLIHDAWAFAGLATLVGKTKATRVAIQAEMLRMQLRRDLHHDGFLASPWRHFVHQHKSFVDTQFNDLKPTQTAALFAAYQRKRSSLRGDESTLIKDVAKYKINAAYRAKVQAKVAATKLRVASFSAKLKPQVHTFVHKKTHEILKEISNVKHKNKKIKIWTLRQYDLDISQLLRAYKAYNSLGQRGRKEVLVAIAAFKDLNRSHKTSIIKTTLQAYNAEALSERKKWTKFFKGNANKSGSYAYAVAQDWLNVGQYIGGKLLTALQSSFQSAKTGSKVSKEIRHDKAGERIFDDILGGFWLNHYLGNFIAKNASLITVMQADRLDAAAKLRSVEMVLSNPQAHKLATYWLRRNSNSVIAKDLRAIKVFERSLEKKIHKWELIEKIGHYEITENNLQTLQSLHKNQMLGVSLAAGVSRTSRWQDLSLQQQAADRESYDNWIAYNQSTYHGLDKSYKKFNQKDISEADAWKAEQAQIASGQSFSVGYLLKSVEVNDSRLGKQQSNGTVINWQVTPKPPLQNSTQHLEAAAANLASLAHDPHLLTVSLVAHADSHSGTTPVKPNPSLWAYIMQIRHWSHKIKKKLSGDKDEKAKAEAEAKKAKDEKAEAEAEAKKAEEDEEMDLQDAKQDVDNRIGKQVKREKKLADKDLRHKGSELEGDGEEVLEETVDDSFEVVDKDEKVLDEDIITVDADADAAGEDIVEALAL